MYDLVHCPAGTKHVIVAAGAHRHGAGVGQETTDQHVAYARFAGREPTR